MEGCDLWAQWMEEGLYAVVLLSHPWWSILVE